MTYTLYHLAWCPYCLKVRRAADRLGIDLDLIDISRTPGARDRLVDELGRGTVPVLAIPTDDGERLLPESDDIVAFLERAASAAA